MAFGAQAQHKEYGMTDYESLQRVMTRLYENDREAYHVVTNLMFWEMVGADYKFEKLRARLLADEKRYQARIQELLGEADPVTNIKSS